jgi:hypothetical protein
MTSGSFSKIVSITFLVSTALVESLVKAAFNESIFHEINLKISSPVSKIGLRLQTSPDGYQTI